MTPNYLRPDEEMRRAMAAAEVGDDVLDHDPTMAALEERVAALLGVEAALWVPSGSMGNLIALFLHLRRGDRFLAPLGAHVLDAELGTAAWLAGGMPHGLPVMSPEAVVAAGGGESPYYGLNTTLLCLENTHNASGGTVTTADEHARLVSAARSLGVAPSVLAAGADTVQVCLSKGLGAPVGSLVAGSAAFVVEARRVRKMLGGGVRQGGVLAAAGLVALDRVDRLAADHANASALADGLRSLGWDVAEPATNIVLASVPDLEKTLTSLRDVGVFASPMSGKVRFVTHGDVDSSDIAEVLRRLREDA